MLIKFQEKNKRENTTELSIKRDNGSEEFLGTEDSSQIEEVHQDPTGKRKINYTQKNHSKIAEYQEEKNLIRKRKSS